jgi:hypothetical protein
MKLRSILACTPLLAALALAATPAKADRDRVQFGSNIVVPPGESVHDAVCFFCSVDAKGAVDHDVVVFFGDVHIATHSNHDIVDFFGNVRIDNNASVSHDVVNFFGNVHLGEDASIGNDMVAMFGTIHAADSSSVSGNRVIEPGWLLLIPLMIFGGIGALIVGLIRNYRHRQLYAAGYYPPPPPPPPVQPQA